MERQKRFSSAPSPILQNFCFLFEKWQYRVQWFFTTFPASLGSKKLLKNNQNFNQKKWINGNMQSTRKFNVSEEISCWIYSRCLQRTRSTQPYGWANRTVQEQISATTDFQLKKCDGKRLNSVCSGSQLKIDRHFFHPISPDYSGQTIQSANTPPPPTLRCLPPRKTPQRVQNRSTDCAKWATEFKLTH